MAITKTLLLPTNLRTKVDELQPDRMTVQAFYGSILSQCAERLEEFNFEKQEIHEVLVKYGEQITNTIIRINWQKNALIKQKSKQLCISANDLSIYLIHCYYYANVGDLYADCEELC